MKKALYILLVMALSAGCTSSKKYLEKGNYSMAVKKAVSKLQKSPDKAKEIWVITQAFKQAQQQNLDRISYLRKTGQPDIWEEVFTNYAQLNARQNLVKTLSPAVLSAIGFQTVDYDNDIIEAQKKASEYFYVHGKQLLAKNEKFAARQAYDEFVKIKSYYSNYKDVDDLINQAMALGTTHVLFIMQNNSYSILPADFEQYFMKISLYDLNSKWVLYDTKEQDGLTYDYAIILNIKVIDVSPERLKEKTWIESKEVQDGWTYQYDNNGNVMKDTAGNDIKVPKYVRIACNVNEISQNKEAVLSGKVDFYNNITKQLLQSEPVNANSVFTNFYYMANGNLQALTPETQKRLGNGPLPFPNDFDMIMMANDYLQKAVKDVIRYRNYNIK
ncbi:MAG: hypothetical protein WCQ95_09390 [Bacteroidota bacterium]